MGFRAGREEGFRALFLILRYELSNWGRPGVEDGTEPAVGGAVASPSVGPF